MEKVKVVVAHDDPDGKGKDGVIFIDDHCYYTDKDYREESLNGHEIRELIDKCVPAYTVDAIHNENTQIK